MKSEGIHVTLLFLCCAVVNFAKTCEGTGYVLGGEAPSAPPPHNH